VAPASGSYVDELFAFVGNAWHRGGAKCTYCNGICRLTEKAYSAMNHDGAKQLPCRQLNGQWKHRWVGIAFVYGAKEYLATERGIDRLFWPAAVVKDGSWLASECRIANGLLAHTSTAMRRIMYIEYKGDGLAGHGRIGWVEMTRTTRSYIYGGKRLQKYKGGYKWNCFDVETSENYWVTGPKKNGQDRLYGGIVEIDEDARVEYWMKIRNKPECVNQKKYRS